MLSTKMTMFLRSFLRGPNLLGTGSPGSIFKGRRKQQLEVFLPRKDASGVGPCDELLVSVEQSLLQEITLFVLFTGFYWWTRVISTRNGAEAVSFLILSLLEWRVPDFCDTPWVWVGRAVSRAVCPGTVHTRCSQPHGPSCCSWCVHTSSHLLVDVPSRRFQQLHLLSCGFSGSLSCSHWAAPLRWAARPLFPTGRRLRPPGC